MKDLKRNIRGLHLNVFVEHFPADGIDQTDLHTGGPNVYAHDVGGHLVFRRLLYVINQTIFYFWENIFWKFNKKCRRQVECVRLEISMNHLRSYRNV